MVQPAGSCYNGCCRSQPCQNGGTCVEHCDNPKEKFSCTCRKFYNGKVCENELDPQDVTFNSCLDVLESCIAAGKMPGNGLYGLVRVDKPSKPIHRFFCAFEGTAKAWTLIESFSLANKGLYVAKSFGDGFVRNSNPASLNWADYRLSHKAMHNLIRPNSTMFRATCDFPIRVSLTPDFLLGNLSDCDIIKNTQMNAHCCRFTHINIRGYDLFNTTAPVWHSQGSLHFHTDPSEDRCSFSVPGAITSEDVFGFYDNANPNFTCTARQNSTTQWWLGQET